MSVELIPGPNLAGAVCADPVFDPESWFIDDPVLREQVVEVCHTCPVMDACLAAALDEEARYGGIAWGVRGGLTASERQAILDARRAG